MRRETLVFAVLIGALGIQLLAQPIAIGDADDDLADLAVRQQERMVRDVARFDLLQILTPPGSTHPWIVCRLTPDLYAYTEHPDWEVTEDGNPRGVVEGDEPT